MAQFSLSWNSFKDNICSGLTALQQNGEFVDMTIAADGHHVKVHQMVMSLVSPYIKDLISSAQCPHPVIFLNRVSYSTLLSILEYIYTGEVIVNQDNLDELVQAGRDLHIKGLEDMKIEIATYNLSQAAFAKSKTDEGQPLSTRELYKTKEKPPNISRQNNDEPQLKVKRIRRDTSQRESYYSGNENDDHMDDTTFHDTMDTDPADSRVTDVNTKEDTKIKMPIQYTVSNQGSIQMIVNRYLFNLRYTSVRDDGTRRWQCTDAIKGSCKATVFTQGGVVVKRCAAHNHPYHDRRILKKVNANLVFSALNDVEAVVKKKKNQSKQEDKDTSLDTSLSKNKNTDREDTTDAE